MKHRCDVRVTAGLTWVDGSISIGVLPIVVVRGGINTVPPLVYEYTIHTTRVWAEITNEVCGK